MSIVINMQSFHIEVYGKKGIDVARSIDIKSVKERAIRNGCPLKCSECGCEIDSFVDKYKIIPSDDLTIRIYANEITQC